MLEACLLGADMSGGGAPSRTVKGLATLAETLGKLGFLAPVTICFVVSIGRLSLSGISKVLGTTLR